VELVWKYTRPSQHNRCAREIALTIKPDAPSDVAPGVHAVTRLADGSITVYYGRLRPLAWNWPSLVPTLLAQTFAHEIGHSLQRLHRHSDTGILKAHWTIDDFHAMQEKQLRFTPLDAELIRAGAGQYCTTEP
jgi:hypothetical protein